MESDLGLIIIQVATIEPEAELIEAMMTDVLRMVHAEETSMRLGPAEHTFGWNFYTVSIERKIARQLVQLPHNSILEITGDTLEQKFVGWLNRRANVMGAKDKVRFSLLSDLKSSRYGLF